MWSMCWVMEDCYQVLKAETYRSSKENVSLRTCKLQILQWNLNVSGRTKWSTTGARDFSYLLTSGLALGLTEPSIEGCPWLLGRKESVLCLKLRAYYHVTPWLRSGAWLLFPMYVTRCAHGQLCEVNQESSNLHTNNRNMRKANDRECCN
jgi:hypothetical protein